VIRAGYISAATDGKAWYEGIGGEELSRDFCVMYFVFLSFRTYSMRSIGLEVVVFDVQKPGAMTTLFVLGLAGSPPVTGVPPERPRLIWKLLDAKSAKTRVCK
jgi:hypothetical protein